MTKVKPTKENLIKIAKGAGIAGIGAILVYLTEAIPGIDFGIYTPIAVAIFSILVNYVRKVITQ